MIVSNLIRPITTFDHFVRFLIMRYPEAAATCMRAWLLPVVPPGWSSRHSGLL
jgi:hypothetical protein